MFLLLRFGSLVFGLCVFGLFILFCNAQIRLHLTTEFKHLFESNNVHNKTHSFEQKKMIFSLVWLRYAIAEMKILQISSP